MHKQTSTTWDFRLHQFGRVLLGSFLADFAGPFFPQNEGNKVWRPQPPPQQKRLEADPPKIRSSENRPGQTSRLSDSQECRWDTIADRRVCGIRTCHGLTEQDPCPNFISSHMRFVYLMGRDSICDDIGDSHANYHDRLARVGSLFLCDAVSHLQGSFGHFGRSPQKVSRSLSVPGAQQVRKQSKIDWFSSLLKRF